jgi:acyl-CoA thioesterase-2
LDLQRCPEEQDCYIGKSLDIGSINVYGGHVLSQAVIAARRSVSMDKYLHSFHSYFLHPGDISLSIKYRVEIVKRGKSFDVVRILASQNEKTIFILSASFHISEDGINHQTPMPNVADATTLKPFSDIFMELAENMGVKAKGIFSNESPIVFHPVEYYDPFNPGIRAPQNHVWFKINGEMQANPEKELGILAYVSDFNLLVTALLPHNMSFFKTPMQIASLDHAMWFHRKFQIDEWMLYVVESTNAHGSRALCHGKIYNKKGELIASVAQEGLIRKL